MSAFAYKPFWTMVTAFHVKAKDGSLLPFNLADGNEASLSVLSYPSSHKRDNTTIQCLGDVGYLDPRTDSFVTLFNAFDPSRTGARSTLRSARPVSDPLFSQAPLPRSRFDSWKNRLLRVSPTKRETWELDVTERGRFRVIELVGKEELVAWLEYYMYEILHVYRGSEHVLEGVESLMIRTGGLHILPESNSEEEKVTMDHSLSSDKYTVEIFGKLTWPQWERSTSRDSLFSDSSSSS